MDDQLARRGATRAVIRRTGAAVCAGLLTAAIGGACTGKDHGTGTQPGSPPSAASGSPSLTVAPEVAEAEAQARAVYAGYIEAWTVALQTADPDNPDLPRYAADPVLQNVRSGLRKQKEIGAVYEGEPGVRVLSARVDLGAAQPTVSLTVCLDYTHLTLVYQSTRSPVPNRTPQRPTVPLIAKVGRFVDGQWLVNFLEDSEHAC